ncbi:class A sortase [Bacillus sp. APMAM]|nr:class A sortase [Bacillus sp. APMAM]RTZ56659.1 class A sortase [Bacillus sp. SAJ1]
MARRRKLLVYVLIIAGLLIIFSPYIKEGIINYISSHLNHKDITAEEISQNNEKHASFDFNAISSPSFINTLKESTQIDSKAIIGRIKIKSVGISLPIMKGTTNSNLLAGATTMRPDQKMGIGNYPLAGHHMRNSNLLFGPLMKIKVGAKIVITDLKNDYIYKVTSKNIIDENQTNVIKNTHEKLITLITCDRATSTNKRLFVQGKLIKVTNHNIK